MEAKGLAGASLTKRKTGRKKFQGEDPPGELTKLENALTMHRRN